MSSDPLKHFYPLIQKWFLERLGSPTNVQARTWAEVIRGSHVLVTAPTGSGKTLAAFLWAIDRLVTGAWPRGQVRVLYVSPLKALNTDVRRNLLTPLAEIEEHFRQAGEDLPTISVQTRSGDTPGSERHRMLRHPPEILITTPESLNILLTSGNSRHILTGIETVILDEIHAVIQSKRGTHLITAVDRLVPLCGEFQRIALSATVRPFNAVADFVGGLIKTGKGSDFRYTKREVSVVRTGDAKQFEIRICCPEKTGDDHPEEFWLRLTREFKKIIADNRSTLFFANSRRTTEKVTRLLNEDEPEELAYSHHGSLSREIRLAVEEKLKRGELKAIVATNSLELGIDIGKLDSVVLIQSPRSISSTIQRIGRSGHGVGEVSRGLLFPTHGLDFLEAAVIARSVLDRDMQAFSPVEAPLDVLSQVILSMALVEEWDIDDLFSFLKTSYPYRNISRAHFDLVTGMLAGRYADSHLRELRARVSLDRIRNTIRTKENVSTLIFMGGGTIPDRGYFDLRLKETGAKIGELDEEFVWERTVGDAFTLGTQAWLIKEFTHNDVVVAPTGGTHGMVPFWRGEEVDRDYHLSRKIASFLEEYDGKMDDNAFTHELTANYCMSPEAAEELARFLRRQRDTTGTDLPHRHHLLIEHFDDPLNRSGSKQIILHTLWGNKINRPFTIALSAAWERQYGYPLSVYYNNDAVILFLPHAFETSHIFSLVTPENIESLLRMKLEGTGYFGARFRENAGRALLLTRAHFKKRMPLWLNRLRSKRLLSAVLRYRDFPILIETWRSCLQDDFDIENLKGLLAEIQDGRIRTGQTITASPSPFAGGLIWQQMNKYMYADDTPESAKGSALSQDLIKELVFSSHLRPRIPSGLVRVFESKTQRTAEGYSPDSGPDLIDWVKERLVMPGQEWTALLDAMSRDHNLAADDITRDVAERIAWLTVPGAAGPLICAVEMVAEIAEALGRDRDELSVRPLVRDAHIEGKMDHLAEKVFRTQTISGDASGDDSDGDEDDLLSLKFLGQWLSYYGPVELARAGRTLGMKEDTFDDAIRSLEKAGQVVLDQFREESTEPEACDASNLEVLLRLYRRSRQPAFQPLDMCHLPLFLAAFQGLTEKGETLNVLQERLERLFGIPLSANTWEEEIFPARIQPYYTAWVDSLMQTSDLTWFGCGDRKLTFAFPEDLDLFREDGTGATEETDSGIMQRLFPDRKARYSFADIHSLSGLDAAAVNHHLWSLTWRGQLTNDSFVTVRKGILSRFRHHETREKSASRRPSANRWKTGQKTSGNWYMLKQRPEPQDVLEREEIDKDRVRVLLNRYGIIFKELLLREQPPLQWQRLFRTLRIMELSGEMLSGCFFKAIPGLQFISHEAYRMLAGGLPENSIYWLNAADPASLCGTGLEELRGDLPARTPTSHLVYHGTRLVVVSRRHGKELQIHVAPDDTRLSEYLSFLKVLVSRDFNPLKRILVERINGKPARESEYQENLKQLGFHESYKGLELWKSY